jgi:hypothetical protein
MEGGKYQLRDWFFPFQEEVLPDKVELILKSLHDVGLIIRYQHKDLWYLQLPKAGNWNCLRGNMREESDFPAPSQEDIMKWREDFKEEYTVVSEQSGNGKHNVYTQYEHSSHTVCSDKDKDKDKDKEEDTDTEVQAVWNATSLPKCITLSSGRKEKLRQRLKSKHFRENYKAAIEKLSKSSFAKGHSDKGWKVSIDWFLDNDTNYVKALEGKYDDKPRSIFEKY